mmetsp:Transcript_65552/g.154844  ORF Transcript_65552/g.154844 Transcript_65552/m.154844 type:complete len:428 (-) Transcript_65552:229-1512(-)
MLRSNSRRFSLPLSFLSPVSSARRCVASRSKSLNLSTLDCTVAFSSASSACRSMARCLASSALSVSSTTCDRSLVFSCSNALILSAIFLYSSGSVRCKLRFITRSSLSLRFTSSLARVSSCSLSCTLALSSFSLPFSSSFSSSVRLYCDEIFSNVSLCRCTSASFFFTLSITLSRSTSSPRILITLASTSARSCLTSCSRRRSLSLASAAVPSTTLSFSSRRKFSSRSCCTSVCSSNTLCCASSLPSSSAACLSTHDFSTSMNAARSIFLSLRMASRSCRVRSRPISSSSARMRNSRSCPNFTSHCSTGVPTLAGSLTSVRNVFLSSLFLLTVPRRCEIARCCMLRDRDAGTGGDVLSRLGGRRPAAGGSALLRERLVADDAVGTEGALASPSSLSSGSSTTSCSLSAGGETSGSKVGKSEASPIIL